MNDPDLITESGLSVQAGRYAPYYLSVLNNRLAWGASQDIARPRTQRAPATSWWPISTAPRPRVWPPTSAAPP